MDNTVTVILIGILEGLTEFLPISSTGHLIIASSLLSLNGAEVKAFLVVIQLGAILAVCWHQRLTICNAVRELPHKKWDSFATKIAAAFIPTACIGLMFHDLIKTYLFSPISVSCALILGGIVIIWVEHKNKTPVVIEPTDITVTQAIKIGFFQALAIFPGVSRSGATIIGGLTIGLSRKTATLFSFLLAIPTMFAATIFDLTQTPELLTASALPALSLGFCVAFITALMTVKVLINFVSKHSFKPFGYYRIIFGVMILLTWESGLIDWPSV